MQKHKVCLIFLLSLAQISWAVADFSWQVGMTCPQVADVDVVSSLKLQGFKCSQKKVKSCSYSECSGKVSGYSKNVLVLIPEVATRLRVHFRGHKTGNPQFAPYDQDLKTMVDAFQLAGPICSKKELVVMPDSAGKCEDFDRELIDAPTFAGFFQGIHEATGSSLKDMPVHASAHSGGGRSVARMLKSGIHPAMVTIFDGIYSDEQEQAYQEWMEKGGGKLNVFSLSGREPSLHGRKLMAKMDSQPRALGLKIKSVPYQEKDSSKLRTLERQLISDWGHYGIVMETWLATED